MCKYADVQMIRILLLIHLHICTSAHLSFACVHQHTGHHAGGFRT